MSLVCVPAIFIAARQKRLIDERMSSGALVQRMRGHLFAAGLRELFALSLETLAPEDMVRNCAWFEQAMDTTRVTRRQRALYATFGGLLDNFLKDELGIDPDEPHNGLGMALEELNKRTHVRPGTLMEAPAKIEAFAERVIRALNDVF
ncbi:MAG: hypothetical protein J2P49_02060 [Methylocapsa sp.]|nr:hypothetical protein [Methylocapsa sp.]